MWSADQISVSVEEVDGSTVLAVIGTPAGTLEVLCEVASTDRRLYIRNAHIQGLQPGDLGRAGLNAIAAAVLESLDVDVVVFEGASRTTGANPGRRPRTFRYPHGR